MKFLAEEKSVVLRMMCMLLMLCLIITPVPTQAAQIDGAGSYEIGAKLSCYVNAMGGVEFGEPLMTGAVLNVGEDGSESITIYLTKSSVTIYSVTCDTFIDADPGNTEEGAEITNGTIGYYDAEGRLITDGVPILALPPVTSARPRFPASPAARRSWALKWERKKETWSLLWPWVLVA